MQATGRVSAGYLFGTTLADFLRLRKAGLWLVVAVVVFAIGKAFSSVNHGQSADDTYITLSTVIVYKLLALVAAIFSTGVISQEVEQRTIGYLLTRPVSRAMLILSRTGAAIVTVALITWVSAFAAHLAVGGSMSLLTHDMIALGVGAVAYTSLFVLISLLINRAMLVCLLFAFGWETAVPNMREGLNWLSINSYLTSIAGNSKSEASKGVLDVLGGVLHQNPISASTAWGAMAGFSAVCLATAAWWFTHFEFVPREDAE
jgi:ABC-2 type transport system permease protein